MKINFDTKLVMALLFLSSHQAAAVSSVMAFMGNVAGVSSPVSSLQLTIYSGNCNLYSQSYASVPLDASGNFTVNLDGSGTYSGNSHGGSYSSLQQIFDPSNSTIQGDNSGVTCSVNGTLSVTAWRVSVVVNGIALNGYVPIDAFPFAINSQVASNALGLNGISISTATPVSNQILMYTGTNWAPVTLSAGGNVSIVAGGGGLTISSSVGTIAANQITSGTVGVSNGGTGLSVTPSTGQILIGNGTGGYSLGQITGDSGVTVASSGSTITISGSNGSYLPLSGGSLTGALSSTASISTSGNISGDGMAANTLTVNGTIESKSHGFVFPDGTTQTTAAGLSWTYDNHASVNATANTGIFLTGSTQTVKLPTTSCSMGQQIMIASQATNPWTVSISTGNFYSRSGVAMTTQTSYRNYDSLLLICNASGSWQMAWSTTPSMLESCSANGPFYFNNNSHGAFQFPEGCHTMTVEVWGAGGGAGSGNSANGGAGGYTKATFSMIPGGVFLPIVGAGGNSYSSSGGGGNSSNGGSGISTKSGSGGGGTALIPMNVAKVLIAAGGGGGGGSSSNSCGGSGGGSSGSNGGSANPGGGATMTSSGVGGSAGYSGSVGSGPSSFFGWVGTGGSGGGNSTSNGGGGGGGGYYGGGGGGASTSGSNGAGGGGGSGFYDSSGLNVYTSSSSSCTYNSSVTDPTGSNSGDGGSNGNSGKDGLIKITVQ